MITTSLFKKYFLCSFQPVFLETFRKHTSLYLRSSSTFSTPRWFDCCGGTRPMFTHATDDLVCVLTSGFHFIIWVYFNLTTKGLNIPRQLPPRSSSPRRFIIIIAVVVVLLLLLLLIIITTIIIIKCDGRLLQIRI